MKETIKQFSKIKTLQLSRLERLADVIYALVLWRLFTLIPKPVSADGAWHTFSEYLAANGTDDIEVVFDNDDRVAMVAQADEYIE